MVNNSMVYWSSMVNWCHRMMNKGSRVSNRSSMVDRLNRSIGRSRCVAIHLAISLGLSITRHTDKSSSGESLE